MFTFFSHQKLLNLLNIGLLAVLAYLSAQLVWQYLVPTQNYVALPVNTQQTVREVSKMTSTELARSIINLKPFGSVKKAEKVPVKAAEVIDAPETKLAYKLRGVYYSENEALSSAIIELKANNVESYQIKDEVEKGINIHAIKLNQVILERYGKLETLSLEETKFNKNDKSVSVASVPTATNAAHNNLLTRYRQRFASNPMVLAKKFRSIPVSENGKNIGFKLQAIRGETLLKKLNVPTEAVFTAINGVGLDKPFQALDALKSLQTAKDISVTYVVNGNEETRNFKLN